MAIVRKHWLSLMLFGALVMVFIIAGYSIRTAQAVTSEATSAAELDEYSKSRLKQICDELSISESELKAIGCSDQVRSLILSEINSWYVSNQEKLKAIQQQMMAAENQLSSLNDYPDGSAYIAAAENCRQLFMLRQDMLASLASTVESKMDYTRTNSWNAARNNRALSGASKYCQYYNILEKRELVRQAKINHRSRILSN